MVIKVFGVRTNNCSNLNVACSHALLLDTSFSNNFAHQSGAALVVTQVDGVLVSCDATSQIYDRDFMSLEVLEFWIQKHAIKKLNSSKLIGTFGQTLNITIDSHNLHKLFGDVKSGFVLPNVSSGHEIPRIVLTTLDAFGNVHAPTLHEKNAILLEAEGFLQQQTSFSFVNGTCSSNKLSLLSQKIENAHNRHRWFCAPWQIYNSNQSKK